MAVAIKTIAGEVVVVTGVVSGLTRSEVFDAVARAGGLNAESVSAKTTLLVIGEKPGATKVRRAEDLSIPTITEAEFRRLIA